MSQREQPVFSRRTVLEVGIEACPGVAPGTGHPTSHVQVPVYDIFPIIQPAVDVIEISRGKDSFDPERFATGIPLYRLTGRVYHNPGSSAAPTSSLTTEGSQRFLPPGYMRLMQLCGYIAEKQYDSGPLGVDYDAPPTLPSPTEVNPGIGWARQGETLYYLCTRVERNKTTPDGIESLRSAEVSVTITSDKSDLQFDLTGLSGNNIHIYRSARSGGPYVRVTPSGGTAVGLGATFTDSKGWNDPDLVAIQPPRENSATSSLFPATGWGSRFQGEDLVVFRPVSDFAVSGNLRVYMASRRMDADAARGSLVWSGTAGQLVQIDFDLQGRYNDEASATMPTFVSSPGVPPKFCGTNILELDFDDDGTTVQIEPVVSQFSFNTGMTPVQRLDANNAKCLKELIFSQEADPRIGLTVEMDRITAHTPKGFDYKKAMVDAKAFRFALELAGRGSSKASTYIFVPDFTAQQAAAPQISDDGGITKVGLDLKLTGSNNDFVYVIYGQPGLNRASDS